MKSIKRNSGSTITKYCLCFGIYSLYRHIRLSHYVKIRPLTEALCLTLTIVFFSTHTHGQFDTGAAPFKCIKGTCDANTSDEGGDHHDVDLTEHRAMARAQGNGALARTAFAEVGVRFRPCFTGPVEIQMEDIDIIGHLRGFGGGPTIRGEVEVRALLRDLTDDLELSTETLFKHVEEGDIGYTVNYHVDINAEANIQANLVENHTYEVVLRVDARKWGLNGRSNFQTGGRGVSFNTVKILPELDDSDGDGLFDVWETSGVDLDCDGVNEIDLPTMGASPSVKDVFLELDWMVGAEPKQAQVQAVINAFDAAPPSAGDVITPGMGVKLWVDTGNLSDPTASENGAGPNTCGDGIDNSPGTADGLIDENDPDCLVGSLAFSSIAGGAGLGEGNGFAIGGIPDLSVDTDADGESDFEEAKFDPARGAFDVNRLLAFRYAISGVPSGGGDLSGQATGNNFILFNKNAGLLMHELGHTLGLNHGGTNTDDGTDDINCKPNYVSIMNYRYLGGIRVAGGLGMGQDIDGDGVGDGLILDYSPPRFPSGRGTAPLGIVNEAGWSENTQLDVADTSNFFAWTTTDRQLITAPLNGSPDWNNDGDTNDASPPSIDFNTALWNPAASEGGGSCGDGIDNNGDGVTDANDPVCNGNKRCALAGNVATSYVGGDDWSNIQFNVLRFENVDAENIPAWFDEPSEEEIEFTQQAMQTTDLSLSQKIADPDLTMAGQEIRYTSTIRNLGPNPAGNVVLNDQLPGTLIYIEGEPSCLVDDSNKVNCIIGELLPGESRDVSIVVRVRTNIACVPEDQFSIINNTMAVENTLGPDIDLSNNTTSVESRVLCRRFEYAAKLVCGKQENPDDLLLTRGAYASSINVHNPNDENIYFFKKLALSFPPAAQRAGNIIPISIDELQYDEALKTDCNDLRQTAFDGEFPSPYIEGFVVLQSARSLDVAGVYTAASLNNNNNVSEQSGLHIETIKEREFIFESTDLEVRKSASSTGSPTTQIVTYTINVNNLGGIDATNVIVHDLLEAELGSLTQVLEGSFFSSHGGVWTLESFLGSAAKMEAVIPILPAGESATLKFVVEVRVQTQTLKIRLLDTVSVSSAEKDYYTPNNNVKLETILP